MSDQHRICIVVCYFGHWPAWFNFYLKSCQYNPSVDFLIFSDCGPADLQSPNVRIVESTMEQFNQRASEKLGLPIDIQYPYKLCDLKPAFGIIFADYLEDYDFWGNSDLDIVYGDIRSFLSDSLLSGFDVITAREEYLAGHLILYRNCDKINRLYEQSADYPRVFLDQDIFSFTECARMWRHMHNGGSIFDEEVYLDRIPIRKKKPAIESMSHVVRRLEQQGELRAYFRTMIRDRPELLGRAWRLVWEGGSLKDTETGEDVLYFHMIGTKDRPGFEIPGCKDIPERFFITSAGFSTDGELQERFIDRLNQKIPLWNRFSRWRDLPY